MAVKEIPTLPAGFRKGTRSKVSTVKALMEELQQLPPAMKVIGDFGYGVKVSVTNYNDKCLAVKFDFD